MHDEDDDLPPFQPLRARLAGEPVEERPLDPEVSKHLEPFLRAWIEEACSHDEFVALRAAMRLRVIPFQTPHVGEAAHVRRESCYTYIDVLRNVPAEQLLDVVDAILFFHGAVEDEAWFADYQSCLSDLHCALEDAGSAFRVADNLRQLVERVDATVTAATDHAAAAADPTAAELLRDAWRQTYGRHPDPTTAYRQAVRAVEQIACPLVLGGNPRATLGMVVSHLRDAGHRWSFVLLGKDDAGTVEPVVTMLERLWSGQVSRHGGAHSSRDQTQQEAEAAVHLAAVLVQWLTAGALRRTTP